MVGRKDKDFGSKLAELQFAVGYLHDRGTFSNASLARRIGVDDAVMRRKRIGTENIDNRDISTILALLELGGKLDPSAFLLEPQSFKSALKAARIGIYAGRAGSDGLATLLKLSENERRCSVTFSRRPMVGRGSGLGLIDLQFDRAPALKLGERVKIALTIPKEPGFLALLNDCLGGETFCLSPSSLMPEIALPSAAVKSGSSTLPSDANPDAERFGANGPIGHHRLFAIWCKSSEPFKCLEPDGRKVRVSGTIAGIDVDRLAQAVKDRQQAERAVAAFDYRVEG